MTRKRFVKRLMGAGASRDAANWYADRLPPGASYSEYSTSLKITVFCTTRQASMYFRKAAAALARFGASCMTAATVFDDALRQALGSPS